MEREEGREEGREEREEEERWIREVKIVSDENITSR